MFFLQQEKHCAKLNTKESDKKRSQMSWDAVPVFLGGNCLLCFNGSKYITGWYPLFTPLKWSSFHSATSRREISTKWTLPQRINPLESLTSIAKNIYMHFFKKKKEKKIRSLQLSRKIRFITTDFCYDPKWPRKTQIVIKILFPHIFVFLAF